VQSGFGISAHWRGGFDEAAIERWAAGLRTKLDAPHVSLGLVFLTPQFFDHAADVLEILRVHAQVPVLAGCSSQSLIVDGEEIEENAGLALALFHLPGAEFKASHFTQEHVRSTSGPTDWHGITGVSPKQTNGWLVFACPTDLDGETWLREWNAAYARLPTVGGLAGGLMSEPRTQLYLNGDVFEEGVVAVSVGGAVKLEAVISQGCTPIGDAWTITRADRNFILAIGNRPAYSVLVDTFNALPREEQQKAQGNLFVGFASSEYQEEFKRGDFLVRNLLGADPQNGVLAVGAIPRPGQTIQFQRRDAASATEDLVFVLNSARERFASQTVYGACLCCCNGRGQRLFGKPNHDASLVQEQLGPLPVAGFFCNGELGPVGEKNFLHGYTASLALFVKA
jgi:small ligand-binding sensory domain FIST